MRMSDWSSDVCSSDLASSWRATTTWFACSGAVSRTGAETCRRCSGRRLWGQPTWRGTVVDYITELLVDGVWQNITSDVRDSAPIVLERGRRDWATETDPSTLALRLNNGDSRVAAGVQGRYSARRSDEHTHELQSLMRNSYAVFCLTKEK